MAFFKKEKDPRIEEITLWARTYLEERRRGTEEPEGEVQAPAAGPPPEPAPVETGVPAGGDVAERAVPETTAARERGAPEPSPAPEVPSVAETAAETEEVEAPLVPAGEPEAPVPAPEPAPKPSLLQRLRSGLSKTRAGLVGRMDDLFSARGRLDEESLEDLEEILIASDMGVRQSLSLIQKIREGMTSRDFQEPRKVKAFIREEITEILGRNGTPLRRPSDKPWVVMVVGVNGVGKTTTIGKLAWRYRQAGEQVLLAAGDTFRAAAAEQLAIWAERVGADVVRHKSGADPSAVIFDALQAAKNRGIEVVIADTAGRLHTKVNLMEELKKMKRVMDKVVPGAPHEVLLVLDATTGQNALSQARTFHEAVGVTGVVLTKLDGTAKGGIVTAIVGELGLPVKLIGIGEQMEDLRDFEPETFVSALFDG